jgi:hypothetical protein
MRALPLVFAAVYAFVTAAPSAADPSPAALRHVRPRNATAALLLRFGHEKSARFREIVRTLEQSNVMVYVEVREDSDYPVSGGLTFLGEAHGTRWVRAMVDSGTPSHVRTCQDIVRLTAILGHELQHALEAAQAPTLQSVGEFERYFRSIGVDEKPRVLDTLAARQTGKLVADELRGMNRRRSDDRLATTEAVPAVDKARTDTGS